jgi:hypothetical protein
VAWRETERDEFGLPIPKHPNRQEGPKHRRAQLETYASRDEAEARRNELNAARHTTGTANPAQQRKAGDLPFGTMRGRGWTRGTSRSLAASSKPTRWPNERLLGSHELPEPDATAMAAITPAHCERFLTALVGCGLTPGHGQTSLVDAAPRVRLRAAPRRGHIDRVDFRPVTASVGTRYPIKSGQTAAATTSSARKARAVKSSIFGRG